MKTNRFSEEQIIGFLKLAEAGMQVRELCRKGGFSDATFHRWRAKYGGMDVPGARRLRDLESENAKLKRLRFDDYELSCVRKKLDVSAPLTTKLEMASALIYPSDRGPRLWVAKNLLGSNASEYQRAP